MPVRDTKPHGIPRVRACVRGRVRVRARVRVCVQGECGDRLRIASRIDETSAVDEPTRSSRRECPAVSIARTSHAARPTRLAH